MEESVGLKIDDTVTFRKSCCKEQPSIVSLHYCHSFLILHYWMIRPDCSNCRTITTMHAVKPMKENALILVW